MVVFNQYLYDKFVFFVFSLHFFSPFIRFEVFVFHSFVMDVFMMFCIIFFTSEANEKPGWSGQEGELSHKLYAPVYEKSAHPLWEG